MSPFQLVLNSLVSKVLVLFVYIFSNKKVEFRFAPFPRPSKSVNFVDVLFCFVAPLSINYFFPTIGHPAMPQSCVGEHLPNVGQGALDRGPHLRLRGGRGGLIGTG